MDNQDQVTVNGLNTSADDSAPLGGLGTPPPIDNQAPATDTNAVDPGQLQDIKNQALTQLTPMLKNLNQSPEEHFKTLMMLIQASDNQSLIKEAYDTAQQITDEQAKANALLDIVNEINYFTLQEG